MFGTKAGQIFVLDRKTGEHLTKVEERAVPKGNIEGETYSPTQPFSVGMPGIGASHMRESDRWGATPFDQLLCRVKFKSRRYTGLFTPPGTDPSLNLPGSMGGTLATQGGLVFIAATQDYFLRAYDTGTGKEAWKARLPVGSQGTPISYKSPVTGQQFVLISAGGARNSPDRGDHVIAYALPK